jgi:HD superfamily phosphodiesterase
MTNTDKIIRQVEATWLKPLMDSCKKQFSGTHLPSHDHLHHERVWKYARELIVQSSEYGMMISEKDIERLIIAVFFHDQGMSETTSKEHGKISRKLCKNFIQQFPSGSLDFFDKVLDAIEFHDQKEYVKTSVPANEFELRKFLNTADDLDAFGNIGAYRYLEIYIVRNMNLKDIPEAVNINIEGRYKHFTENFGHCIPLANAHSQRYLLAKNFFRDLNKQIGKVGYSPELIQGPVGVVNYVKNEILDKRKDLFTVCTDINTTSKDDYCIHFFSTIQKELNSLKN